MAHWGRRGGTRARALLLAAAIAFIVPTAVPAPVQAAGPACATPGRDGTATLSGVVNTYYPGTATAAAGTSAIALGPATGAATPIAVGDLLLVIQMQDATIDSTNTGAYGDGVAGDPASGWTALNSSGLYEYTVATSAVPLAGGSLTVGGSGLINTYTSAAQHDFQVIRVPQYVAATLTATLTAAAFNGSTGGVLALDVDGALNLSGVAVSVSQEGFRAGLGRQLTGGPGGTGTDYRNLSANNFHGQKGEGIAGTPQYVYNSLAGTNVNNAVDGYPNGSTARGAPGTAGGGGTDPDPGTPPPNGNDQNTGGGGGANGGTGGRGGNSWNTNLAMGGFGGTAFPATAARLTAGAGGGAGTRNNSGAIANASSGGSGGGIVMIRTGSVAGAGTIVADGGTGVAPDNDGGGGGGAGGSITVVTQTGALGGLTTNARGGVGTDAWHTDAGGPVDYHGPGGGGGGGVVLTTSAPGTFNVNGGANGTTTTDLAAYGATPGAAGTHSIITANQIPGTGSGASCTSDLTIGKSHVDPFVRGSTGTYTLTVSNVGGTATSGTATVTDTLPAGLTPTAAAGAGWTCGIAAQTVTCTSTAVVASNGSYPAISTTVSVDQAAPSSVTNTATVAGGGEVNTANDTATDPTNVVSRADIGVAKIASSGTVTVGSNVNFTVTVTNNGPTDATGVQVTDLLPAGLTYVSSVPSQGTYTSLTGLWNIGALASGASVTLTLTATVTATGSLTNTATKTAEIETDPNAANNSASVTITGQAPDLTIAKSHVGSFVRGSTGSYTVTVSNIGPVASSGLVTVSDTLPAGLTPSTAVGTGWTCGIAAQTVTCTRSDALAAAGSYPVITVTVSISQAATSPLTNTATVAGGNELNTANDSASDSTTITSQADIGITKIASSGTVTVGSNVTFTITTSNLGPSNATGVQVTDLLPAGLTYVSSVPSQGTYTSVTGLWNIGAIASGASVTLTLTATVTTSGSLTNTATKSAENEADPNAANNSASVTITGQAPDLTITKSHVDPFVRGTTNTYQLVVSNIGPVSTSGTVTVADTLPAGLTPTLGSGTGWACGIVAQTVTCTRNDALASTASYPSITITVTVLQTAPASVTNTATVAGGNEVNIANDTATDPTNIASLADVGVTKAANGGSFVVGANVTFTITATNFGPSNATGVHVTDSLPAGLTYVSSVPSQGIYTSGTGDWNIGPLASGASASLTLTATVTQTGSITNTATKSAENESDPNPGNNSASATITAFAPDLTITKSHTDPFVRGTTNTYQLLVSNVGTAPSSGLVTVSDTVPAGLTPTLGSGTGWGCGIVAQTVTCTRPDALAPTTSYPTITITVTVLQTAPATLTNSATVGGGGEINLSNDTATDPTNVASLADIAVAKSASASSVIVGSNVTFTITATNNGPSNATGVHVSDPLPTGLAYVSSAASQGTYTSGTGDWNIGPIASGNSVTLTLVATVTQTGALTNTATKSAENESDPNLSNDSASATLNALAPDLTIAKSHTDPFVRGTTNTYQLVVSNIGPVATSGLVTVTDTLPAGLTPTLSSGTGWACGLAGQTVTCTRSDALAAAAAYPTITITVTVLQTATATVTNSATVGGGGEVNTGNDTATDPTTVTSVADVAILKSASGATVIVGSNVSFTITATNNGPSDATGVHVTDPLPAGLSFVSAAQSAGIYTNGTGDWNIGPLASGSSATLTLIATVTQTGPITNTATKSAENETDPNSGNNSASATITGLAPDLTITKSHTDPFVRGTTNTYQLVVSNIGTAPTSGLVTVTDTVPAGLAPTLGSGTGWACGIVAQTVTCTRSDALAITASYPAITITVTVLQTAPASLTNSASVGGGNEINTANDTANDATNIASVADIAVTKIASSGTIVVGANVNFTITATNNGPSNATGVHVTDSLPTGLTYVSSVASQGAYTSGTGDWNIGAIASGGSATLTLTATVTQTGAITNTASKSAENESDPNVSNDSSSATLNGLAPDLTITKSHTDPFVRGTTNTYQLVVSNIGTAATIGLVTVTDTLPAGLTPTLGSGTGWSCGVVAQTVTCTRSDALTPTTSYPTITVTVTVLQTAPATLTNSATVGGGGEINTGNDTATDPTNVASLADIALTKTASSGTVTVGSNVTFTITAHNAGPSNGTGVQVTDPLPAGLTLVSATPATGTFVSGTGVWTIGPLASGASTTLAVVATVTTSGAVMNTARKTAENESDPNPGNDVSSATITGTGLPGPPNGGMAPLPNAPDPLRGSLLIEAALAGFFGLLFLRRRSHRVAIAAGLMAFATMTSVIGPAGAPVSSAPAASHLAARPSDLELFGKPILTVKPQLGTLATTLQPAKGPITPYRIRIPALAIDTVVESVGVTARGLMDVPGNIWDAAWLQTGVKPGAPGQAVIDGHLDSVNGSAVFADLHRLKPGDRIYVSDAGGNEVTFAVTTLQVEPLDGFPTLRVFGPAHGRFLNLITCAGQFDSARRTYDHRLVVFAELA